jgi:hypothetical protein
MYLQLQCARLAVEMHCRRLKMRQHPAGTPMVFPWTVRTCSWLGWRSSGEEVAAKGKKGVSNKDHLIAAKEKTTRNTRRELGYRRGDNGANPQHVPAKNKGDKGKSKK